MKPKELLALTLGCTLALAPVSAAAKDGSSPAAFSMRLRQILMQMQKEATENVSAVMADACSWLGDYGRGNDHFPATDVEAAAVKKQLSRVMPANPFNLAVAQRPEASRYVPTSEEERINVNVVIDTGLDLDAIGSAQDLPPDSWQAPAGTVTVVSNGYHLAAIWASGADQRPIREPTGKVRILIARCRR